MYVDDNYKLACTVMCTMIAGVVVELVSYTPTQVINDVVVVAVSLQNACGIV